MEKGHCLCLLSEVKAFVTLFKKLKALNADPPVVFSHLNTSAVSCLVGDHL